jgi:hypothetical protein
MPSPSIDVALSCPFSSLNLRPFVISNPHSTILVDEEESGCPENIPSRRTLVRMATNSTVCLIAQQRARDLYYDKF